MQNKNLQNLLKKVNAEATLENEPGLIVLNNEELNRIKGGIYGGDWCGVKGNCGSNNPKGCARDGGSGGSGCRDRA